MAHLVSSVSDVLDALHRDRGLGQPRVKADLQRASGRGSRPRGCANGEWGWGSACLGCPGAQLRPSLVPARPTDQKHPVSQGLPAAGQPHPCLPGTLSQPHEERPFVPTSHMSKTRLQEGAHSPLPPREWQSQSDPNAWALKPK